MLGRYYRSLVRIRSQRVAYFQLFYLADEIFLKFFIKLLLDKNSGTAQANFALVLKR